MVSSRCPGVYRFHLKTLKNIDVKADQVITLGDTIYIILNNKIILKIKENDVLCWTLKK